MRCVGYRYRSLFPVKLENGQVSWLKENDDWSLWKFVQYKNLKIVESDEILFKSSKDHKNLNFVKLVHHLNC